MPAIPGRSQPPASSGTPAAPPPALLAGPLELAGPPEPVALPNAAAVSPVSPQARPAAVLASDCALASLAHAAPSRLPSWAPPPWLKAISSPPGAAASASGTSARPGLTGLPDDHAAPLSAVVASGEKARSWLGRKPVTSDAGPRIPATRPPLSATPAGVTCRHFSDPAGRANSCQKSSCCALEPPITTMAQLVPVAAVTEAASSGGAAAAGCCGCRAATLPQPAISSPAMAGQAAAARQRRQLPGLTATSSLARRRRTARLRTMIPSLSFLARGRSQARRASGRWRR